MNRVDLLRESRKYVQLFVVLAVFSAAVLFRHIRAQASSPAVVQPAGEATATSQWTIPTATPVASPTRLVVPSTPAPTAAAPPAVTPTATPTATPLAVEATSQPPKPAATVISGETPTSVVRLVRKSPTFFDAAAFKDGSFAGKAIYTKYGTMQVEVVIKGGQILEVVPIQEPRATGTSSRIADELIPAWIAEAIEIQDWDVDGVSGATITWEGFKKAMVYALRTAEQKS